MTFGYADDASYLNKSSATITSLSNFTYALKSLGLGPIYYTNGTATSYYYQYLSTAYPVQINTNFVGLGEAEKGVNQVWPLRTSAPLRGYIFADIFVPIVEG